MPTRPARACAVRSCAAPAQPGHSRCAVHATALRAEYDRARPSAAARGYDDRWRVIRAMYLKRHPHCELCGQKATEAHHIIPLRDGGSHRDVNLQALCQRCHSAVTMGRSVHG